MGEMNHAVMVFGWRTGCWTGPDLAWRCLGWGEASQSIAGVVLSSSIFSLLFFLFYFYLYFFVFFLYFSLISSIAKKWYTNRYRYPFYYFCSPYALLYSDKTVFFFFCSLEKFHRDTFWRIEKMVKSGYSMMDSVNMPRGSRP